MMTGDSSSSKDKRQQEKELRELQSYKDQLSLLKEELQITNELLDVSQETIKLRDKTIKEKSAEIEDLEICYHALQGEKEDLWMRLQESELRMLEVLQDHTNLISLYQSLKQSNSAQSSSPSPSSSSPPSSPQNRTQDVGAPPPVISVDAGLPWDGSDRMLSEKQQLHSRFHRATISQSLMANLPQVSRLVPSSFSGEEVDGNPHASLAPSDQNTKQVKGDCENGRKFQAPGPSINQQQQQQQSMMTLIHNPIWIAIDQRSGEDAKSWRVRKNATKVTLRGDVTERKRLPLELQHLIPAPPPNSSSSTLPLGVLKQITGRYGGVQPLLVSRPRLIFPSFLRGVNSSPMGSSQIISSAVDAAVSLFFEAEIEEDCVAIVEELVDREIDQVPEKTLQALRLPSSFFRRDPNSGEVTESFADRSEFQEKMALTFRSNSVAMKLVSTLCKRSAPSILSEFCASFIINSDISSGSFEIDPSKVCANIRSVPAGKKNPLATSSFSTSPVDITSIVEHNGRRLVHMLNCFLDLIRRATNVLPSWMCRLCRYVGDRVSPQVSISAVLFLRLFCIAIADPQSYGITLYDTSSLSLSSSGSSLFPSPFSSPLSSPPRSPPLAVNQGHMSMSTSSYLSSVNSSPASASLMSSSFSPSLTAPILTSSGSSNSLNHRKKAAPTPSPSPPPQSQMSLEMEIKRGLLLASKALQNLANGVPFKETYMQVQLADWLHSNQYIVDELYSIICMRSSFIPQTGLRSFQSADSEKLASALQKCSPGSTGWKAGMKLIDIMSYTRKDVLEEIQADSQSNLRLTDRASVSLSSLLPILSASPPPSPMMLLSLITSHPLLLELIVVRIQKKSEINDTLSYHHGLQAVAAVFSSASLSVYLIKFLVQSNIWMTSASTPRSSGINSPADGSPSASKQLSQSIVADLLSVILCFPPLLGFLQHLLRPPIASLLQVSSSYNFSRRDSMKQSCRFIISDSSESAKLGEATLNVCSIILSSLPESLSSSPWQFWDIFSFLAQERQLSVVSLFTRSVLAQSLANIERTGLVIEGVTPSLLGLLELIANLLLRVAEKKLFSSVDPVSASANQFIEEQHTFLCKTLEKWVSTVPANMSYPLSLPPSMDPDALEILRRVIQEDCNSLSSIFKSETITLPVHYTMSHFFEVYFSKEIK